MSDTQEEHDHEHPADPTLATQSQAEAHHIHDRLRAEAVEREVTKELEQLDGPVDAGAIITALRGGLPIRIYPTPGLSPKYTPKKAHPEDAGLDIYPLFLPNEPVQVLQPGSFAAYKTGWSLESLPVGTAILVLPRSGKARKFGVTLTNSPGLVDPGYQGPLDLLVINHGPDALVIRADEPLAQLLFIPTIEPILEIGTGPTEATARGTGGFGSTDVT